MYYTPKQLRVLRDMQRFAGHISHIIDNAIKYAIEHPDQTAAERYLDALSFASMYGERIDGIAEEAYKEFNK